MKSNCRWLYFLVCRIWTRRKGTEWDIFNMENESLRSLGTLRRIWLALVWPLPSAFYHSFPLVNFFTILPSDWTGPASDELILVIYSCAREGLKIERYIKPALRRGRGSLLPAARPLWPLKGGSRPATASSFSAACLQLRPLLVLRRGLSSLPGQPSRV